jgi:anti-anti-sigma regulatory factor
MDQSLQAQVKLDVVSDVVRIDVRGSLTHASRPSLMQVIQRVRRMGISSHIRVDLGRAAFVESSALAGLRNDLNAIDGGGAGSEIAGMPAPGGVSLELSQLGDDNAMLETLDLSGELTASLNPTGTGPLTGYSDDALLAASDAVFGLLDDPADMARTELLATYDEIGMEISRREVGREPEPA